MPECFFCCFFLPNMGIFVLKRHFHAGYFVFRQHQFSVNGNVQQKAKRMSAETNTNNFRKQTPSSICGQEIKQKVKTLQRVEQGKSHRAK